MTNKFNRAVLLLAALSASVLFNACKDDECEKAKTVSDDNYLVSSFNIMGNYFKPKMATIYTKNKTILGDWYANDKIALKDKVDLDLAGGKSVYADYNQEYAEHYPFLSENGIKKYLNILETTPDTIEWVNDVVGGSAKMVMLDQNDILSPYKEYAEYYGDTCHLTNHESFTLPTWTNNACVLPLIAIDVVCDKNFDENHPAGSSLNDILFYDQTLNTYDYLKNKEYQGEVLRWGRGSAQNFEPRILSQIPDNPVYLMESAFEILFDHEPTAPGTYEFTVKFTFGEDPLTGETVDIAPAKVSIEF